MSLDWRCPPGDRRKLLDDEVLAELRANPGRWARIRQYRNKTAIDGLPRWHPSDIELRGVTEDDGSTAFYARAKGDG